MSGGRTHAFAAAAVLHAPRFTSATAWTVTALSLAAAVPAGLRWLRVAQREHYLPGSVSRFAGRWWFGDAANALAAAMAFGALVVTWWWPVSAVFAAAAVVVGPWGLGLRGRTSALAWTRRLRTLTAIWVGLSAVVVAVGTLLGVAPVAAAAVAVLAPFVVDAATAIAWPLERSLAARHVRRASERLARIGPTVVAITGSFGKTSTKGHVAQLVGSSRSLVATPASFNNRAGLARAVNESLAEGTEVFVAEMGTYGRGEIAELCRWCPPDVAVITAIGPVHLERFGSEERILEVKSEILERARTAVLPIDDARLADLADRTEAQGKVVRRVSAHDRTADVCVDRRPHTAGDSTPVLTVFVGGEPVAKDIPAPLGVHPLNVAVAFAVALELGLDAAVLAGHLGDLRTAVHRSSVARAPSGVLVVDDTYNANPAGASAALDALCTAMADGDGAGPRGEHRLAVATPGMVELGRRQGEENARFAASVARRATDLLIVGRTNRRALLAGAEVGGLERSRVHCVDDRQEAVAWVRQHLGAGDGVLYENDLPDHYP